MSSLAVLPIILSLLAGAIIAIFNKQPKITRVLTKIFIVFNLTLVSWITYKVFHEGAIILETGSWVAPYGIVFVADSFAIVIVLATNIVATASAFIAPKLISERKEMFYFYAFFFFLISGVSGAFLTGDLFNLFVFFEVLLMASYGLIVLGGNKEQLRESLKYVLINLFSSVIFVTTIAFLYSVVGTVNMAHIAERVHEVEQQGILTTIGIVLFFVFATKAALFPLFFWMPKAYIVPNPVISALFGALLTKVGIYSIIRIYTLIFIFDTTFTHNFFMVIAGLSMLIGVIGALSTNNIKLIVAYNVIPSIGFILMGLASFNATGLSGSAFYLVHDMIIKAALFLLVGVIAYVAGTSDLRKMGGLIHQYPVLGWMLFISAFVLAGIPPFSGFIGKILLLQGSFSANNIYILLMALLSSLLILYSIMKIFIRGFWGEKNDTIEIKSTKGMISPIVFLMAFTIFLGIGAELVLPAFESIGTYLLDPEIYINSVLKE